MCPLLEIFLVLKPITVSFKFWNSPNIKMYHSMNFIYLFVNILFQVSLGSPASINQNYPDCRITCIRCVNLLGIPVTINLNAGGYGCSNAQGSVNLGVSIGLCQIFGVRLAPGQGTICPT